MALLNFNPAVNLNSCSLNKTFLNPLRIQWRPMQSQGIGVKPLLVEAKMRKRANSRTESPKIRNRRLRKKEAATVVGEELVKAAINLNISEISSYDRNGFSRGERMQAFETAISEHGFLPR
uniref:50S ribosomal protein L18 n=1 Tax=Opuntia streptacantha TaxID=393608 RepID=A0A7C8Z4S9_OPUST